MRVLFSLECCWSICFWAPCKMKFKVISKHFIFSYQKHKWCSIITHNSKQYHLKSALFQLMIYFLLEYSKLGPYNPRRKYFILFYGDYKEELFSRYIATYKMWRYRSFALGYLDVCIKISTYLPNIIVFIQFYSFN